MQRVRAAPAVHGVAQLADEAELDDRERGLGPDQTRQHRQARREARRGQRLGRRPAEPHDLRDRQLDERRAAGERRRREREEDVLCGRHRFLGTVLPPPRPRVCALLLGSAWHQPFDSAAAMHHV